MSPASPQVQFPTVPTAHASNFGPFQDHQPRGCRVSERLLYLPSQGTRDLWKASNTGLHSGIRCKSLWSSRCDGRCITQRPMIQYKALQDAREAVTKGSYISSCGRIEEPRMVHRLIPAFRNRLSCFLLHGVAVEAPSNMIWNFWNTFRDSGAAESEIYVAPTALMFSYRHNWAFTISSGKSPSVSLLPLRLLSGKFGSRVLFQLVPVSHCVPSTLTLVLLLVVVVLGPTYLSWYRRPRLGSTWHRTEVGQMMT